MSPSTADNQEIQEILNLYNTAATQHTPVAPEPTPASDLEMLIEHATDAVLEEIESIYQSESREIAYRDHERIEFSESVRICPANLSAVPTGRSMMAEGRDLSLWGVSLAPPQRFEVDDCLLIEFKIRGDQSSRTVTMLAQVRNSRPASAPEETIGCQFLKTFCSATVPAIA